ncbi:hypothetical protein Hypma_016584 [Hypsizygus marmoreus]|uniref:Uncharacterized protein n=1 Tax=Hypsizygus marmoreus TaxID=39966 RepID=A0A369IYF6_HYPMA|nr:hypothetical protein Hypma_016584 [Hypsizygus marmoreus]
MDGEREQQTTSISNNSSSRCNIGTQHLIFMFTGISSMHPTITITTVLATITLFTTIHHNPAHRAKGLPPCHPRSLRSPFFTQQREYENNGRLQGHNRHPINLTRPNRPHHLLTLIGKAMSNILLLLLISGMEGAKNPAAPGRPPPLVQVVNCR